MNGRQQTDGNLALEQSNVIVIEAAQRPEAQKLRVAAYCRVSSDSSDQLNSFVAQLNRYTALITSRENWSICIRMRGSRAPQQKSVPTFNGSSRTAARV